MRTSDAPLPKAWKATSQAAAILLLLVVPSLADTFTKVRITANGGSYESVYKTYMSRQSFRLEYPGPDGRADFVVGNTGKNQKFYVDTKAKTYWDLMPHEDFLLTLSRWIARPPGPLPNVNSGKTVHIYYETIDTGEREEFFGHTAKHLILRERTVAEAGACMLSNQSEREGWYLSRGDSIPNMGGRGWMTHRLVPMAPHSGPVLRSGSINIVRRCEDTIVEHGESTPGIAIRETSGGVTRELVELSNAPLDQKLFEIPDGYVNAAPAISLESKWRQLESAFQSWFN